MKILPLVPASTATPISKVACRFTAVQVGPRSKWSVVKVVMVVIILAIRDQADQVPKALEASSATVSADHFLIGLEIEVKCLLMCVGESSGRENGIRVAQFI